MLTLSSDQRMVNPEFSGCKLKQKTPKHRVASHVGSACLRQRLSLQRYTAHRISGGIMRQQLLDLCDYFQGVFYPGASRPRLSDALCQAALVEYLLTSPGNGVWIDPQQSGNACVAAMAELNRLKPSERAAVGIFHRTN